MHVVHCPCVPIFTHSTSRRTVYKCNATHVANLCRSGKLCYRTCIALIRFEAYIPTYCMYVIVVVGMYSTSVLAELCWLALSLPSLWIYLTKVPDSLYERLKSGCTVASRWPESATRLTEEVLFTSLAGEDLSGAWAPRWTRAGCCPPCWTLPWVALRCLLMSWRRWLIVEVSINE